MPLSAPHGCPEPGCPNLAPRGQARCASHEGKRDRERGTAAQRGYGPRWKRYRAWYLREHPTCEITPGCPRPSEVVDHIKAHKGDEQLFWDPSNHRAGCRPCHDRRVDEGDFQE